LFFRGNGATSFVGVEALVIFFKIESVDKQPRMTLHHALLVISHDTQYMQGIISATVQGTFTVETGGLVPPAPSLKVRVWGNTNTTLVQKEFN